MSNRLPLALLLALTLVPVAVSAPANAEAQEKVILCHSDGNGAYHKISIADAARETHETHGDLKVGYIFPGVGLDGYPEKLTPLCLLASTKPPPGT
jgi:hypothetical protein